MRQGSALQGQLLAMRQAMHSVAASWPDDLLFGHSNAIFATPRQIPVNSRKERPWAVTIFRGPS